MSNSKDDTPENKDNSPVEEETEDVGREREGDLGEAGTSEEPATGQSSGKGKKGKTLRFALPNADSDSEVPEQNTELRDTENRIYQQLDTQLKSVCYAVRQSSSKSQPDHQLLLSARFRCLEGVVEAIENGADVNVTEDHVCPLIIATENNDKPMVRYLLSVSNININARNIFGYSSLSIALKNGFDEMAVLLLRNNPGLDVVDNFGRTALHEAVFQENYEMVELLIRSGYELESIDSFGDKPIYSCTVRKPNLNILNLLLRSGASCEYENDTGLSLLSRAILHLTNIKVVKKLVMAGANVNHQDHFCKRTPLHLAAITDNVELSKFLIEQGADPDLTTIADLTPFDLALYYRCYDAAEYLAIYTKNAALTRENFSKSLLSRIPKNDTAFYLLNALGD